MKKSIRIFLILFILLGFSSIAYAQEPEFIPVYRHYNPYTGEHLFTADAWESYHLVNRYNFLFEGKAWYFRKGIGTPVYRLYNPEIDEHLYTCDINEINSIVHIGGVWLIDYNGYPCFRSDGPVPIYRLYDPKSGRHLLTTDLQEYNTLPQFGWNQEGIALYGYGSENG